MAAAPAARSTKMIQRSAAGLGADDDELAELDAGGEPGGVGSGGRDGDICASRAGADGLLRPSRESSRPASTVGVVGDGGAGPALTMPGG